MATKSWEGLSAQVRGIQIEKTLRHWREQLSILVEVEVRLGLGLFGCLEERRVE